MWVERYSPRNVVDFISNETQLNSFIKNFQNSNFLIQGSCGIGKSSFSIINSREFFNKIPKNNILKIDALEDSKISILKKRLKYFIDSKFSLFDHRRLIVIDNSDRLSFSNQLNLREKMEKIDKGLHFWLICQSLIKINPTIISRCLTLNFRPSSAINLGIRMHEISEKERFFCHFETLLNSIFIGNGDIRKSINSLFQKKLVLKNNFFPTLIKKNCISKFLIFKLKESMQKDFQVVFIRKIILMSKIKNFSSTQIKENLNNFLLNSTNICFKKKLSEDFKKIKHDNSLFSLSIFFNYLEAKRNFKKKRFGNF